MSATGLRVIVAPDSFKGTLDARNAAEAIGRGWLGVRPQDRVVLLPQADGGEGTLAAVAASEPGSLLRSAGSVTGPDGRQLEGRWLQLPDGTAVIELAQMAGLPLMNRLDPLGATSMGLGQTIAAAIDSGARRLLIGLGGSASTDAGLPALAAIGARTPPEGGAVLLTDVTAPLLGPGGAAFVYGPQKGATASEVDILEARLVEAAGLLGGDADEPGTGAAGGVAFGLARWGASIVSGAAYLRGLTGLDAALPHADVVLTGEGRFDHQSLTGKVVGSLIAAARDHRARIGVIAGMVEPGWLEPGIWTASLVEIAGSGRSAMGDPARHLQTAGAEAARQLGDAATEGGGARW
jgi:glycerate kinase